MTEIRTFEIRQCASFVREARFALREGDHPKAVRYAKLATRGLYFFRGLVAGRGAGATMATAGLTRVLDNLWDAIGTALRPAPAADPDEVLELLAETVRVLRERDGIELDDDAVMERSRNGLAKLLAHYDIRVKTPIRPQPVDGSLAT